jgi:hypothetical protein
VTHPTDPGTMPHGDRAPDVAYAELLTFCRCGARIERCWDGCNFGGWFHTDLLAALVPEQANDAHFCDDAKTVAAAPAP